MHPGKKINKLKNNHNYINKQGKMQRHTYINHDGTEILMSGNSQLLKCVRNVRENQNQRRNHNETLVNHQIQLSNPKL